MQVFNDEFDYLTAALQHVAELQVEAVVLAGNEHSFGSGADLNVLNSSTSVDEAIDAARSKRAALGPARPGRG